MDLEYKVILIGDSFVGKTSIVNRLWTKTFNSEEHPTVAASYLQIPIRVNSSNKIEERVSIKLNIWDTAGTEKFQCLVPLYSRTANALIIVFDISNSNSFEGAKNWYKKVIEEIGFNPISILCGNKIDLDPNHNLSKYLQWAEENKLYFEVTSALKGENIQEIFQHLSQLLYDKDHFFPKNNEKIEIINKKNSCC